MFDPSHFKTAASRLVFCLFPLVAISAVRAEEDAAPETVVVVSVDKIVRTTLHSYVACYGTVETAPPNEPGQMPGGAQLVVPSSGWVAKTFVVEGMQVEPGALLAQLDSRSADAEVSKGQASLNAAEKALDRQKQMEAVGGTSERALQEARERLASATAELAAAQLEQDRLSIRSPITGTVVFLAAKPGEWLDAGQVAAEVMNANHLVLNAQVPITETGLVQLGQSAQIFTRLGAAEEPLAQGAVQYISPRVTPNTNGVLVRIALPSGVSLRPGQFLAARIVTGERANCLAVPVSAVYTDLDGNSTLSLVEGDTARKHAVKLGVRDGDLMEVSGAGLSEGATVVTEGSYALPEETRVNILSASEDMH